MDNKTQRIRAIDILRAITVALMIFVNDIPGVKNLPEWLGHTPVGYDGMFLADIVFPLFLFWVGMSIPLAIDGRLKKGFDPISVLKHILKRTASLVFIGVLMVNISSLDPEVAGIDRNLWALLMYIGVIMTWRVYGKETTIVGQKLGILTHYAGIAILLFGVLIFRTTEGGWLTPKWWGILGLIGWAYLVSALVYILLKNRFSKLLLFFAGLLVYHAAFTKSIFLQEHASWLAIESNGGHAALTFAGVMASLIMRKYLNRTPKLLVTWGIAGLVFLVSGFVLRPLWGIAKLGATPSWVYLSLAIALGALICVWWITEVKLQYTWARVFYPAGTQTFLAYLLPSVFYHAFWLAGLSFPGWMTYSWGGLLKAIAFTLLIIQFTGLLARVGVKLKL